MINIDFMSIPDPSEVDYIAESNGQDYSLLWLLLKSEGVRVNEILAGNSLWSNGDNDGLVCLRYLYINDKLYCFYEPTSVKVDWNKVESSVKERFSRAVTLKTVEVYYKACNEKR